MEQRPAFGGDRPDPVGARAPLALVHHGHQHLITDGYDNHEGLSEVLESFAAVCALHLRYEVPLNLHLSGTLTEAAAWRAPEFCGWVRALRREGLVEIIGSAYSQPVLPLLGNEHNRRQLVEEIEVLQRHLGVDPEELAGFWVPERVWDTARLAPLVSDPDLPNGGYRWVLIDDRLAYRAGGERDAFDRGTAPGRSGQPPSSGVTGGLGEWSGSAGETGDGRHLSPWLIEGAGARPLVAVPISGDLRYAIPPADPGRWRRLRSVLEGVRRAGPGAVAVYADDLEKSAGVGAWAPGRWRRQNVDAYESLLSWVAETTEVEPVLLTPWLAAHPPTRTATVDPGTFYELAAGGAGDDYQGWWAAPAWRPYRAALETVQTALEAVSGRPESNGAAPDAQTDGGLVSLAWKQFMAATYETAWHGLGAAPEEPAPWARATAAHGRGALVTLAAHRWSQRAPATRVWTADVDGDGTEELVMANSRLFAVFAPAWGGRLVALYDLAPAGGRLVVGNPADDWNWQEELHRYMEVPANHPGAFVDVGSENDAWEVRSTASGPDGVTAVIANVEDGSPLRGSTKTFLLGARPEAALEVTYALAGGRERYDVEIGCSPDYLALLRGGRAAMAALDAGPAVRGFRTGPVAVWVELPAGETVLWQPAPERPCGHVGMLAVAAYRPEFTVRLGVGSQPAAAGATVEVDRAATPRPGGDEVVVADVSDRPRGVRSAQ
ncbi:MAG: hypothetical protein ACRDY7_18025 [Acidimicrobiia bacterium]